MGVAGKGGQGTGIQVRLESGSSGARDTTSPWNILPQAMVRQYLELPLSGAFWTGLLSTSCCHKGDAAPQGLAVLWQQGQRRWPHPVSLCL